MMNEQNVLCVCGQKAIAFNTTRDLHLAQQKRGHLFVVYPAIRLVSQPDIPNPVSGQITIRFITNIDH